MADHSQFDQSTYYYIRLKGRLDPIWEDWFAGFTITHVNGDTLLAGTVADQAALHGLLAKIRDLGVPIILVIQQEWEARVRCRE
jgi:hypothetical protein